MHTYRFAASRHAVVMPPALASSRRVYPAHVPPREHVPALGSRIEYSLNDKRKLILLGVGRGMDGERVLRCIDGT